MSPRSASRQKRLKVQPVQIIAVLTVLVSLVFGAGEGQGGLGLLFLVGGMGLVLYPPVRPLPGLWLGAGVGLLLLAAVSFVPGLSFLTGEWKKEAADIHGLVLYSGITAQPWISLDGMLFLAGGVLLFWYWCLHTPDPQGRRQILRFIAVVLFLFSLLILVVYFGKLTVPGWNSPRNLGPFENRNQLSSILAVSLLVLTALFANDIKKHRAWALLWLLSAAVQFYLLVVNYSRAGVVLLFIGGIAWIIFNFETTRTKGRLALGFLVLALFFSIFLIFGGSTLSRFEKNGVGAEFAGSTRMAIQQDALSMIKAQPLSGVGLGNFSAVFPQYRSVFQSDAFVRHPESDWLWLTAEMGIPGLILILMVAGIWLRRVLPLKSGTDRHFRSICLVTVLVVFIHGTVDVPLHRTGVLVLVLFLASLALPSGSGGAVGMWGRRCWRMAGAGMVVWGLVTLGEAAGFWSKPGRYAVTRVVASLPSLWTENQDGEARSAIERALKSGPMTWELYYWRAVFALRSGDVSGARDDFRRARFFEKNSSHLAMYESLQWLSVRPDLAVSAANEMLQRSRYATEVHYRTVLDEALKLGDEETVRQLRLLVRNFPGLRHYYLETAPEKEFDHWLYSDLQVSTESLAYGFWGLLQKRKSDEFILDWALGRPDIIKLHYARVSGMLAARKEWKKAYFLLKNHMPEAVLPGFERSEVAQVEAEKQALLDPANVVVVGQVIRKDMEDGHFNTSLAKILSVLEKENAPVYFHYLASDCYVGLEDWEKAFLSIQRYESLRVVKKP